MPFGLFPESGEVCRDGYAGQGLQAFHAVVFAAGSITPDGSEDGGGEFIRRGGGEDDTDSMLAIKEGLGRGFRRFVLYGALDGARLDHTVANLQGLQYLADRGATGYLVGLREIATVVKGEKITFPASAAGILSLFCLGPTATGVDISGLHYPLENGQLTSGFPLGVSNHFEGEKSEISVKNGSLVMIYGRENGFPVREGIQ